MADTTDLVPADMARSEIERALTELGVRPTSLAKVARVHPGTLLKIRTGRQTRIARQTQGRILEAVLKVEGEEVKAEKHERPRPPGHPSTWTHCAHGHRFTERNTYIDTRGKRRCRICLAAIARRRWDRRKSA